MTSKTMYYIIYMLLAIICGVIYSLVFFDKILVLHYCIFISIFLINIIFSQLFKNKEARDKAYYLEKYILGSVIEIVVLLLLAFLCVLTLDKINNKYLFTLILSVTIAYLLGKNTIFPSFGFLILKCRYEKKLVIYLKNIINILAFVFSVQSNIILRIIGVAYYSLEIVCLMYKRKSFLDAVFKLQMYNV